MLKKNNSPDSAMVLMNLLDNGTIYSSIGMLYLESIIINKNGTGVVSEFDSNPYYFEFLFKDPKSIDYAIKTLLKGYQLVGFSDRTTYVVDNALSYILNPNNIRNYSIETINYLKSLKIKINAERNNGLAPKDINLLINLGGQMNVNSIGYLNYLQTISRLYLEEFAPTTNHQHNNKQLIINSTKNIFPILEKNAYFQTLTGQNKFKYEMAKTIFMFIIIKEKNNSFTFDEYESQLETVTLLWNKYNNSESNIGLGIFRDNAYYLSKLYWKTYGCSYGSQKLKNYFLSLSEELALMGVYDGANFYKTVLEIVDACDEDSTNITIDFASHAEKLIKYIYSTSDILIDGAKERYWIDFSPILETDSPFFTSYNSKLNNQITDFYYGSDYAIKVGKTGIVKKVNGWEFSKIDYTNYDSLWHAYNYSLNANDQNKCDEITESIYNKSLPNYIGKTITIDSLLFSEPSLIYKNINKSKPTLSSVIWNQKGNSNLDGLDYFFYRLMYNYDEKQEYFKNIETLYKFNDLGLPEFFLGYSKCYGTTIQYLSHIYTLGLKAALIKKDAKAYEDFVKLFYSTYNRLSEKNKIVFLNDFIFLTYDENNCVINNQASYVDFNTPFINQLYTDFEKLLSNDSLIKSKSETFEDRVFDYAKESYVLESYLTLAGASQLDNFDPAVFAKLKNIYPKEARVYRNEALYYFRKNDPKLGVIALKKAIDLGFDNSDFFINKIEIEKYHSKILDCFK